MRALIKFAGHDPAEHDFAGVEMAPLHDDEPTNYRTEIDVGRAWELRHAGKSWAQIGCILARESGRPIRYQAASVHRAAQQFRQTAIGVKP